MGLDMYLEGRLYVGAQFGHNGIKGAITITKTPVEYDQENEEYVPIGEAKPLFVTDDLRSVKEIVLSIGCWRKANAVHAWFVRELAEGRDECQEIGVTDEDLTNLRKACIDTINAIETCRKYTILVCTGWKFNGGVCENIMTDQEVYDITKLESHQIKLPTQGGFFFGSTEYDAWYLQGLRDTVEIIDKARAMPEYNDLYIVYRASW